MILRRRPRTWRGNDDDLGLGPSGAGQVDSVERTPLLAGGHRGDVPGAGVMAMADPRPGADGAAHVMSRRSGRGTDWLTCRVVLVAGLLELANMVPGAIFKVRRLCSLPCSNTLAHR